MKKPLLVTLAIVVAIKIFDVFHFRWIGYLIPAFLLYIPLILYLYKKEPIDFLDRSGSQFLKGLGIFLLWVVIIFPPYIFLAHFWMIHVFHFEQFHFAPLSIFGRNFLHQFFIVALPEEFYFRGYLQSHFNRALAPRWNVLGAKLGWSWILTAAVFALAHILITSRWWDFSIFFPALLFGYLRERTQSITVPVFMHAFSNCFMFWFVESYS